MEDLVSIRSNPFYLKSDGEYKKLHNLIFVTTQPEYELSNDVEVVRNRKLIRHEIIVTNEDIDAIIEYLENLKEAEREDLE